MSASANGGQGEVYASRTAEFEREARKRPAPIEGYAVSVMGLLERMKELVRASEEAKAPAEKVSQLELAKLALRELEAAVIPGGEVTIEGLDVARAKLRDLQITFVAFGYYRQAGIEPGPP